MDSIQERIKYDRNLIFNEQDEYGTVEVVENENYRSLHFGTPAKQTEMDLTHPYALTFDYFRLMAMSLLFCPSPKSVLMLGLGGGALAKFLWKYFPKCHFDLIERSPLVVKVARQYFGFPKSPRLHIHVEDAFDFIRRSQSAYDLIFIDLFKETGISELLVEKEFFASCKKLLKDKNSIILLNIWRRTSESFMTKIIGQIVEHFGKNLLILPDNRDENYVFFIFLDSRTELSSYKITKKAAKLKDKTGLDFLQKLSDLNFLKDYGFILQK